MAQRRPHSAIPSSGKIALRQTATTELLPPSDSESPPCPGRPWRRDSSAVLPGIDNALSRKWASKKVRQSPTQRSFLSNPARRSRYIFPPEYSVHNRQKPRALRPVLNSRLESGSLLRRTELLPLFRRARAPPKNSLRRAAEH